MLVLSMIVLILATLVLLFVKKDILSFYMFAMAVCFVIMYIGIIIYIAKIADFNIYQRIFLFLIPWIKSYLKSLPWTLSKIGFLVALGRTLFPYFFLKLSLEVTMNPAIRRRKTLISIISAFPTIILLIYYYPPIFQDIVRGRFYMLVNMIYIARAYIVLYIGVSIILSIKEYFSITMIHCKKNIRFVILSVLGMIAMYSIYAVQDPAQIYNFYIYEYIDMNSLMYIKPSIVSYGYIVIGISTIIFLTASILGISGYVWDDVREERLSKKIVSSFKLQSVGISVFTHSIKNELLATRILLKKINRSLEKEIISKDEIKSYVDKANEYNEDTLAKMNRCYKIMSSDNICLSVIKLGNVINMAFNDFTKRYGKENIVLKMTNNPYILGDEDSLKDALLNIMENGYEASEQRIEVILNDERLYHVITIMDKGKGLSKKEIKNIFKPFYSTKMNTDSWGLGLFFTHKIIKKHFGYIKIYSTPGKGSNFNVMIPKFRGDVMVDD